MNIIISLFALSGFAISWYIYLKKIKNESLVCYIGADCNKVVNSRYSSMLGVPNEIIGALYYCAVIVLLALFSLGLNIFLSFSILKILTVIGGIAALFSAVLFFIQGFVLREWCEYCIASTGISVTIFILEIIAYM